MAEPVVSCQQDAQKAPPTIVTENAVEVVTITDASAKQDSEKPLTAVIIENKSEPDAATDADASEEHKPEFEDRVGDVNIFADLFIKDGGEGKDWTQPLTAYMTVNNVAISSPSAQNASTIRRPGKESLDVVLRVHANIHDYALVQIRLFARGHGLEDENAGQILIWVKDIRDIQLHELDGEETLKQVRHYAKDTKSAPKGAYVVGIDAVRVGLAIPGSVVRTLKEIHAAIPLARQLEQLRTSTKVSKEAIIQLLLPVDTNAYIVQLHSFLAHRAQQERKTSPLARYFKHSPTVPQFSVGHCPEPGDEAFPNYTSGVRITHYASDSQQLLFHVAGSMYDEILQESYIEELPSHAFQAYVVPLGQVERRFLCLLDPKGQDTLLPRYGEPCCIHFPDIQVLRQLIQTNSSDISHSIMQVLLTAENEGLDVEFVNEKAGKWLTWQLTSEEYSQLQRTADERAASDNDQWSDRISQWFTENQESIHSKAQVQGDEDRTLWWKACRVDISAPYIPSAFQTYLVWWPVDKEANVEDGEPHPLLETSLQLPTPVEKETGEEYLDRMLSKSYQIEIKRATSDKTIRAESLAINSLTHPPSAQPPPVGRSVQAFRYLLQFDTTEALEHNPGGHEYTDLLQAIPGLGNVVSEKDAGIPDYLRDRFSEMDKAMKEAFRSLDKLPAGVGFIPGVAGCGKSRMMEDLILFSQFGHEEGKSMKFLYLLNNNEAVEAFTTRLISTYQALGHKDEHPKVVRLYPLANEVSSMIKEQGGTKPGDEKEKADCEEVIEHFLAEYQLSRLRTEVDESHRAQRQRKRLNVANSLHRHAFAFYQTHQDEYETFRGILQQIDGGATLDKSTISSFKAEAKMLYYDFLQDFQGTIVTTPVAAATHAFRTAFSPDVVIIDEAGTLRELTALIPIAFFSPVAWIFTGDPTQKGPYLSMEHDLGPGTTTSNPSAALLTYSTLARAVDAGETRAYLTINYRSLGNLIALPSRLCYNHIMKRAKTANGDVWPEALQKLIGHLKLIHPQHPDKQCRLLVEFSGAQALKVSASTTNKTHVQWTLQQVRRIISDSELKGLGKNSGKPADILILPYYNAQALLYQREIRRMIDAGELPIDVLDRVKVRTLDNAQGDEADIAIGDMVQVTHPGFTAELPRTTLVTTRARGVSILLLNRGMFVNWEHPNVWSRAKLLYRMWDLSKDSMLRISCCRYCETHEHPTNECEHGPILKDSAVCKIRACNDHGHDTGICPKQICRNCGGMGHSANECEGDLTCSRCSLTGHLSFSCVSDPKCGNCGAPGHTRQQCYKCHTCQGSHLTKNCDKIEGFSGNCRFCGTKGHIAKDCPKKMTSCMRCRSDDHSTDNCPKPIHFNKTCRVCREIGHIAGECPNRKCRKCDGIGHTGQDCTEPWCGRCQSAGHIATDCKKHPPKCKTCKGPHRTGACQASSEQVRQHPRSIFKIFRDGHPSENWKQRMEYEAPGPLAVLQEQFSALGKVQPKMSQAASSPGEGSTTAGAELNAPTGSEWNTAAEAELSVPTGSGWDALAEWNPPAESQSEDW